MPAMIPYLELWATAAQENLGVVSIVLCKPLNSCHLQSVPWGCGSPVVNVSDHGSHVMSSSPVPQRLSLKDVVRCEGPTFIKASRREKRKNSTISWNIMPTGTTSSDGKDPKVTAGQSSISILSDNTESISRDLNADINEIADNNIIVADNIGNRGGLNQRLTVEQIIMLASYPTLLLLERSLPHIQKKMRKILIRMILIVILTTIPT
ncbi:uncharacterized protein TNCV_308811 [Trichonephila clavipes]|nr:uncharacterized protein TNCV_308811 [Trichonephila clavipes]